MAEPEDERRRSTITKEYSADEIPFATDGLSAPTYYADTIRGTLHAWGVTKLNLVEHRLDASAGEVKAVHVATIILPSHQVKNWAEYLTRNAPTAEEGGSAEPENA